jgi:hypothetical protein
MKKMSQQQLHTLIEKYFNAETSVADENLLRNYLACGKYSLTPEVEEALAVMSVQRPRAHSRLKPTHFVAPLRWAAAAAVIGVIVAVGIKQYYTPVQNEGYAYVGGKYTNDAAVLNHMIDAQVSELAEQMQLSQQSFDDQLSDLSQVMQQYENK